MFRDNYCPRTRLNPSQAFFTSFRSATFISSFTSRPQIFSYHRTEYWARPFFMQSEHMGSIGPHIIFYLNSNKRKLYSFFFFFFFTFTLSLTFLILFTFSSPQTFYLDITLSLSFYLPLFCFFLLSSS